MAKKKTEYRWCQRCQEMREQEQEDTGENKHVDGRKVRTFKCKACGHLNEFNN